MFKDIYEKYIEGEKLTDEEHELLLEFLQEDYALTEDLQRQLYIEELIEQAVDDKKSEDAFIAALEKRISKLNQKRNRQNSQTAILAKEKRKKAFLKHSKEKSIVPFVILTLVACLIISFVVAFAILDSDKPEPGFVERSNLYIQDIKGTVYIIRKGKKSSLKNGDYLQKGDKILNHSNQTCKLFFISEKTSISIKAKSELFIKSGIEKKNNIKEFYIYRGSELFDVAKQQPTNKFIISTETSKTEVIGTKLEVSKEKIIVFEGLVKVTNKMNNDVAYVPGNHGFEVKKSAYPSIKSISDNRPEVLSYSLIDAMKDKAIDSHNYLTNSVVLKAEELPNAISMRINISNPNNISFVRSILKDSKNRVLFNLDEEVQPYSMTGDMPDQKDYKKWNWSKGKYFLEVEVYNKKQKLSDTASLSITID